MSQSKNKRNMILAIALTAIICVSATYFVTVQFALPSLEYKFLTVANAPSYDIAYLPTEVAWEVAKNNYHIVLDTMVFSDDNTALTALQKGDAQVVSAMPYVALNAIDSGIEMTCIYTRQAQLDSYLVASVNSGITTVQDLVGKTMCVGGIGTGASYAASEYLKVAYPELNGTMDMFVMKGSANRAAALISGNIDATWVEVGDLANLAEVGIHPIMSLKDIQPDMIGMAWWVKTDWKNSNPDLVQKIVDSLVLGYRSCYENNDMVTIGQQKLQTVTDVTELQDSLDYYRTIKYLPVNVSPTQERWDATVEYFILSGQITQDLVDKYPFSQISDMSFAQNAIQRFGEYTFP